MENRKDFEIKKSYSNKIYKIEINEPDPLIKFEFKCSNGKKAIGSAFKIDKDVFAVKKYEKGIEITKKLGIKEHILGLGEKTLELDRRRSRVVMWNTDSYAYGKDTDPLYVSIPFFISVLNNKKMGVFVNYPGRIIFDIGINRYDELSIRIEDDSVEIFIITGDTLNDIVRKFINLTGKPFKIPDWALGHSISRYSYFPQEKVIEVLKEYKKNTTVDALYLDIDYMKKNRIFEWEGKYFKEPKKMIDQIHRMNTKVVTIVDPAIIIDQKDKIFLSGLGKYCETDKNEIYVGDMWAGKCVFPDFLNKETRKWWGSLIKNWTGKYDIDGIWLDMNEPAVFNEEKTFESGVIHNLDDKRAENHQKVHNAYSYFEAMATYSALKNGFILSRAGYAGIQKYAAIWSGDSVSSWEDMKIQIPLLLSLSISGIPYVGCDIGGFVGKSDPELLARYYQMAAFFPIFRNHKSKEGNDQEIYNIEERQAERIKKAIKTRYLFMDYIKELADNAHKYGDIIIRPLLYEFESDENAYRINDEYMLGKDVLFAPILEKGEDSREVYLPKEDWIEFETKKEVNGPCYIRSSTDMPIFIRKNSGVINKLNFSV